MAIRVTVYPRLSAEQVKSCRDLGETIMPNQSDPLPPAATQSPTRNQTPKLAEVVSELLTVFPAAKTVVQISQLTAAANTLNKLSDELTTEVSEVEATLNKLNLGVRAEVKAATLGEYNYYSHWLRLAYGKEAGRGGFIVEEVEADPTGPERETY